MLTFAPEYWTFQKTGVNMSMNMQQSKLESLRKKKGF